jgi:hypothetical protein
MQWRNSGVEMTKYNNRKTSLDGILFDSAAESRRWQELTLMEKCGDISDLQRQVVYKLVVNEKLICSYRADFVYRDFDGHTVVEDVKGVKTPVYRIKAKLMKALYGIEISEVSA